MILESQRRSVLVKIRIQVGTIILSADLLENETAKKIYAALPFNLPYQTWGDEIYFRIPVRLDLENGQDKMKVGDLAYWPPGQAFCIFYGPTPVSTDEAPRAASEVTLFGSIDAEAVVQLRKAKAAKIQVEKVEES